MAFSLVQSRNKLQTTASTTVVQAYTSSVTAGNMLAAYVGTAGGTARSVSISDNVNGSWNMAINTGVGVVCALGYFPNSGSGSITVTATVSGAAIANIGLIIEEWSGVVLTSPLDQIATNFSATGVTSGNTGTTGTLATANELALAIMSLGGSGGASQPVVSSFFTNSTASPVNQQLGAGNEFTGSTAGVQANFTWVNSAGYRSGVATFLPSGIPSNVNPLMYTRRYVQFNI